MSSTFDPHEREMTSKPRVLYLIDSLAAGGAERSLVDVAPRLVASGIDLEVAVLVDRPGLKGELTECGVGVHVIGGTSRMSQYGRLIRFLRIHRPDLLHTTLFESDILGRLAAVPLKLPVVTTLANTPYGPEHAVEAGVGPLKLRAARLVDAATARSVRRFHAVSNATAEACIQRLHLDRDKVDVIPRGRDQARLGRRTAARRHSVRSALQIDSEAPVILAAARQEPQKGLDVLLQSLPAIMGRHRDAVLLLAGREGRQTLQLRGLAEEMGVVDAVRFLGERADVPDLMCAADVFVLPSHREGLPGVVLEAMALEVPIVASDLPTVREAVPDDGFACLVPPGEPSRLAQGIIDTLANSEDSTRRTEASRRRFEEQFDIDAVCAAMAAFYRGAVSS
jgi:glycosyltransferase involved in cell wall biosynthesis